MSKIQDSDYLLNEQYKTSKNLNARINLHVNFSTNDYGWFPWMFDYYTFPEEARILELGCGPGDLWLENINRIPAGWAITLSDFSPGMVEKAQRKLSDQPHPFAFEVIDAQSIPYDDDHFDVVIANHCIYHFPDRAKALSEIRRVLRPGGFFFATTIGRTHLSEMVTLSNKFDPSIEDVFANDENPFTLEDGADQLYEWFPHVELKRYPDSLRVTEAAPLADFILSTVRFGLDDAQRADLIAFIEAELTASDEVILIPKDSGMFIAW